MWNKLPKTQRRVKTLRYSPCDDSHDTPIAATVAAEFLVAHSTSKNTQPLLGPKRCHRFFSNLKDENPINGTGYLKNVGDCVGRKARPIV
jgi:hypothetical protein